MSKKIALILSGNGSLDGTEIQEAVLCLLHASRLDYEIEGVALNKDQTYCINHKTRKKDTQKRNIIVESARITRGNVKDLDIINIDDYCAFIFPGGFGIATNYTDFATTGKNYKLIKPIEELGKKIVEKKIPAAFSCIAPILMPVFYPKGIQLTVGRDADVIKIIENKGAKHILTDETEIVVDYTNKTVSTPAYMFGDAKISTVDVGISKMIDALDKLIKNDY